MENQSGSQVVSKFVDPMDILKEAELKKGDSVADFGCGPGFFTLPAAEVVGDEGSVYAFDIMPQVLESVAAQAKIKGLANVKTKRANLEKKRGSGLDDSSMDLVIIKNMLFQNKNKEGIINEAYRVLKDNGKVLVMEWNNSNLMVGPEENLRVSPDDLRKMLIDNNFILKEKINAGDFHYVIIANK